MPTAAEYLRPEIIAQVERLDLRARFIVEGFYAGLHRSPYHGFSVEFSDHRRYTRGDDLRLIDWNVYAKTDRFYIKQFHAETSLEAHLLMDLSASMDLPSRDDLEPGAPSRLTKRDYATCLAAGLAHMLIHQQDAAGLALLADGLRGFLPARSKRSHLMRLLAELAASKSSGATNLAAGIHAVADRVRKRGLMILLSDLWCEPKPLLDALHRLRHAGHEVMVFCVLDEAEATFPFAGPVRFEDPEDSARVTADAAAIRADYLAALRDWHEEYRQTLSAMRGDLAVVHNGMSFDAALARFLVERRRRF